MPRRDMNDIEKRLRASGAPDAPKPRLIDDFRASQQRHFPGVGATLSSHRPASSTPTNHDNRRSRQPQASSGDGSTARPRLGFQAGSSTSRSTAPGAPLPLLPAPATTPVHKKKPRHFFTVKRALLGLVLCLLIVAGTYAYSLASDVQKVFHSSIFSVLTTTKLKGENTGRVNILVAGNSADDPFHNGGDLTDSIMVASIDVRHHTAFMISVPRDLWVAIPGFGHAKINEAYFDGQESHFHAAGYPDGGMGLLEQVIYQTLGIRANYYALVDYRALSEGVDAVGGVDFLVKSDNPLGLYDPSIDFRTHGPLVNLTNGMHHLNGEQALDLARARGDAYGSYGFPRADFDRTEHQRELILALKQKIFSLSTLSNPVAIAQLFDAVGRNLHTDFTLSEVRRLYDIGKEINNKDITPIGLNDVQGKNYLANYLSPVKSSALIPAAGLDDYTDIRLLIQRLLSADPVVREAAQVVVLNATATSGLAARVETALVAKKVTVSAIGDATANQTTTTIIDNSGGTMPGTLALLEQLYGSHVTKKNPYANVYYQADFIVIVGSDQLKPKPVS